MDKKTDNSRAGFTLVELVVVIAILGILAGVGYVAYNGYISYAHKGVDMQLIGEIEDAMAVEAQSNIAASGLADSEGSPSTIGNIFLYCPKEDGTQTTDGTPKIQELEGQNLIKTALESTFGSSYESQLALTYDGWGDVDGTAGAFQNLGTDGTLGVLQNCVDTFGYVMRGAKAFKLLPSLLGVDVYNNLIKQAGYTQSDIDALLDETTSWDDTYREKRTNIAGNLTALGVAKFIKNNEEEFSKNFKLNSENSEFGSAPFLNHISVSFLNLDKTIPDIAGKYLALGAFVNYVEPNKGSNTIVEMYNNMFANLPDQGISKLANELQIRYNNQVDAIKAAIEENPTMKEKANEYFKSQAETDSKALAKIAGGLNNIQDQLLSDHCLEKDIINSDIFNQLYSNITDCNVMITVYSDGTCDVSPKEADPKTE